jgi:protein-S-isoprenylcysteine O-methyltransferase Ste14
MSRYVFFGYGVFCHALFLATYAWMAAFVGNFGFGILPTMDGATRGGSLWTAAAIDLLLLAAFAVPHSVMARPAFKRWWTKFVPPVIERSTYVLVSCLLMILLMSQWQPLGGVVWDVQQPLLRAALYGLFAVGWLMVPAVSLLLNHFDLFGTRQVWLHLKGRAYEAVPFRAPGIYRFLRHPLYVGWMIAFWATPTMTLAHLLFAVALTAYMLIAIPFEERDLVSHLGERYERYRRETGALLPRLGRRSGREAAAGA